MATQPEDSAEPIYTTVAFKSVDKAAFQAMWADISERYRFCADEGGAPTQAFAVAMGDMFRKEEIIETIIGSDLDSYDKCEAIGELLGTTDIEKVLVDWELTDRSAQVVA